nr:9505_t:CDS:2 [Entrophospora candida]
MVDRCLNAKPQKRPSAKKLYRILQKYTLDYRNSRSEFYKQVKAIEESKKKFPTYEPNKLTAIHSMAIYTSHLLDFENLPEPVNTTPEEIYLLEIGTKILDKVGSVVYQVAII